MKRRTKVGLACFNFLLMIISGGCATSPSDGAREPAGERTTSPRRYTGRSDFRLLYATHLNDPFDPNQNLLKAEGKEAKVAEIRERMAVSTIQSMIPILGNLRGENGGSEGDMLNGILGTSSTFFKAFSDSVAREAAAHPELLPISHEFYLIPWAVDAPKRDLFYDAEKISAEAGSAANVLGVPMHHPDFPKNATRDFKKLQARYYEEFPDQVFPIGMASGLVFAPGKQSKLVVSVLLGLKPTPEDQPIEFTKSNDQVRFEKIVVPDIPAEGIVAVVTLVAALEQKPVRPVIEVRFGKFEKFDGKQFVLAEGNQIASTPRMVGKLNYPGFSWTDASFSFTRMLFQVEENRARLADLNTLVSVGFSVAGSSFAVGGFQISSVNKKFQDEINQTIDQKTKEAIDKKSEKIESIGISKQIIQDGLSSLLGGRRSS